MRFAKGHGTGNDFVIVPDLDGKLTLSPALAAALCDRHFGIGADGVLRVVRSAAAGVDQAAEWFMDYRNADGSLAEMCGNGIRVFARYLIEEGLTFGPEVAIATRAGTRTVRAEADGQLTVDMGPVAVLGEGAVEAGSQLLVGLAISVGNPHLACVIDAPVEAVDLTSPRVLEPAALAGGVNVEIVRLVGPREIAMRVHERGSGLTLSCGTGAIAAAVAAAWSAGERPAGWHAAPWTVHVPGGRLAVALGATASLLTGPAEVVARGHLAASWLARQRPPAGVGSA
ncbi:MAG TPA: diaminopimelate epimerase [Streptosporangiaceae bacterium]|nr:diaminopimelate epimerase [Streptosporangiaceae bacterium]